LLKNGFDLESIIPHFFPHKKTFFLFFAIKLDRFIGNALFSHVQLYKENLKNLKKSKIIGIDSLDKTIRIYQTELAL
jgi:hypothetical protein